MYYKYTNKQGEEFYVTQKDTYYGTRATIIEEYYCNDSKRIITHHNNPTLFDKVVEEYEKLRRGIKDE